MRNARVEAIAIANNGTIGNDGTITNHCAIDPCSRPPGMSGGAQGASDSLRVLRRAPNFRIARDVEWDAVVREDRPSRLIISLVWSSASFL